MTLHGREKRLSAVPVSPAQGVDSPSAEPKTCLGQTRAGAPCGSFTMQGSDWCFSHSPDVTDGERKAAWRLGGLISTSVPDEAAVKPISLRSRAEVLAARENVFALTRARVMSSSVASVLLAALLHADQSRHRDEALQIERRGRRAHPVGRLEVSFPRWFEELARGPHQARPVRALPPAEPAP